MIALIDFHLMSPFLFFDRTPIKPIFINRFDGLLSIFYISVKLYHFKMKKSSPFSKKNKRDEKTFRHISLFLIYRRVFLTVFSTKTKRANTNTYFRIYPLILLTFTQLFVLYFTFHLLWKRFVLHFRLCLSYHARKHYHIFLWYTSSDAFSLPLQRYIPLCFQS